MDFFVLDKNLCTNIYEFKTVSLKLNDYIKNINYPNINDESSFHLNDSISNRNSLCKINDTKFTLLINDFNDLVDEETYKNKIIFLST